MTRSRGLKPIDPALFSAKVGVMNSNGCTLWLGTLFGGYGYFSSEPAHRASWRLHKGQIPAGLCVLHKCDVPACVNPSHLFLGTQLENMQDMRRKGRDCRDNLASSDRVGEDALRAILTEAEVVEILSRASSGERLAQLAREFGVCRVAVSAIVNGKNWRHIPRPPGLPPVLSARRVQS